MVNKKGGKKHKRTKKVSYSTKFPKKKHEFEDYGYVITMNGGQHCSLMLSDGIEYKGVIRGSLKKKHIFIKREGIILVERRDFQDCKVDITFQYDDEQLDELKNEPNFKSLQSIIDKMNNRYDAHEPNNVVMPESEEEEEEDFYSTMNRLTDENVINLDDI
jgi:initiation factor 1A